MGPPDLPAEDALPVIAGLFPDMGLGPPADILALLEALSGPRRRGRCRGRSRDGGDRSLNTDESLHLIVDKPFVFALCDCASGIILVAGYVRRLPAAAKKHEPSAEDTGSPAAEDRRSPTATPDE
jgi:hypothetical protein